MRQSLGGAGYTAWSGLPKLIEDYSPNVTFEGDNTVMSQQSCNFLMKHAKKLSEDANHKLEPSLNYIRDATTIIKKKCAVSQPDHFLNLDIIDEALKVNACSKLVKIMKLR